MFFWGLSTALHAWVRHKWQLYTLRIIIGCLEGMWNGGYRACDGNKLTYFSRLLPRHRNIPLALLHALRIRTTPIALLRPGRGWWLARRHYKLSGLLTVPRRWGTYTSKPQMAPVAAALLA